jgi:hypothetical protein
VNHYDDDDDHAAVGAGGDGDDGITKGNGVIVDTRGSQPGSAIATLIP